MSNYGKIAIGTRLGRGVDAYFVSCWTKLILNGVRRGDVILAPACEMPHHCAVENLLIQFIKNTECDTLCLIDDDMIFDADSLSKLRDSDCDFDLLSALYVCRRYPHVPIDVYEGRARIPGSGIYEVTSVGFGFTLIKRNVIEKLREVTPADEMVCQWGRDLKGEDFYFCERARQQGFSVGLNASVKIGHRFNYVSVWDDESKNISIELLTK